jgi:hypothetical protein
MEGLMFGIGLCATCIIAKKNVSRSSRRRAAVAVFSHSVEKRREEIEKQKFRGKAVVDAFGPKGLKTF